MSRDDLSEGASGLSLADMAERLEVSRETLRLWLRKWPDFPVLERGTHGQRYNFDPEPVVSFVRARRQPPRPDSFARPGGGDGQVAHSLRAELEAGKLELLHRQVERLVRLEAVARRELVQVPVMLDALTAALQQLGKTSRASVSASCRELNLPDAAALVLERNLAQAQRDFVRALPEILRGVPLAGEDGAGVETEG